MSVTSSSLQVLLIEDSPTDRLMAAEALAQCGIPHGLHDVANGVDAMSFLRREGRFSAAPRPDIILLDLNLPKKDGREVLAEVKSDPLLKLIPVVVLTTSRSDEDLLSAYGNHASSYITKPLDFGQFKAALDVFGAYWLDVVKLPTAASLERLSQPRSSRSSPPTERAPALIRLLLVEDSPSDALLLRQALDASLSLRFEVTQASRLSEARELLTSQVFDVITIDLGLPDCQGLETYRKIRESAPGLPIIVLSGLDDELIAMNALRQGAQDYVVKGEWTAPALSRAVRYAIDKTKRLEQLRHTQRLEAVGHLAAAVANDFNDILGVVRGNAERLAASQEVAHVRQCAREIQQASDRATALARQLLTLSRQQPSYFRALDLNRLVRDFAPVLSRALNAGVRPVLALAAGPAWLLADPGMLEQMLLTLASNADDAMVGTGELRIETAQVVVSTSMASQHTEAYSGRFVKLSFCDTGGGMPAEVLERIFEPFFSTKTVGQGHGFGLPTVHGIVQQHRGWLKVKSRPGFGTRFDIFLPLLGAAIEETASALPAAEAGPATVLLVDDENLLRGLMSRALKRQGYRLLEAGSVAEALGVWAAHAEGIDLLVTDLVLPGGRTGKHLAEALVAARPGLKVIFMSGYSPDYNAEGFVLERGVNFLQKPFSLSELTETVRQRLAEAPRSTRRFIPK